MNNEILFKVKCTDNDITYLTVGKEYDVVEVDECFYKIKNDDDRYVWYYDSRFEVFENRVWNCYTISTGEGQE